MAEKPKPTWHRVIRALLPNAAWDGIKYLLLWSGVSGIATLAYRALASIRGLPHDRIIDIAIFAFSLTLFALAYIVGRYSRKRTLQPVNSEVMRKLRSWRRRPEPTPCPYQELHDLAYRQASDIARHVELEKPQTYNPKLTDSIPSIGFRFPIRNYSVFAISIDENIEGKIYLDGKELADPIIVRHNGEEIGFRQLNGLAVEQRLTTTEANLIKTKGATFYFEGLTIMIKGGEHSSEIQPKPLTITRDHALVVGKNEQEQLNDPNETKKLKREIESLKSKLARLTELTFEVDTKYESDARVRPHHDSAAYFGAGQQAVEIDMYFLTAEIKVCFENHDIHRRRLKRIELSLIETSNGNEQILSFLDDPVMLEIDIDNGKQLRKFTKFDFEEQQIETVWLHFNAQIPPEVGERLNENYFLRLTLHALGQQPLNRDLNVNWVEALSKATYLRSRSN
jgi:hypothetical protein